MKSLFTDDTRMCSNFTNRLTATNTPLWLSTNLIMTGEYEGCQCYLDAPKGTEVLLGPVRLDLFLPANTKEGCDYLLHLMEGTETIMKKCLIHLAGGSTVEVWTSRGTPLNWRFEATSAKKNNFMPEFMAVHILVTILGTQTSCCHFLQIQFLDVNTNS